MVKLYKYCKKKCQKLFHTFPSVYKLQVDTGSEKYKTNIRPVPPYGAEVLHLERRRDFGKETLEC